MKNVVITGSTRGIGLCMALEFLKSGCNVTLSGRCAEMPDQLNEIKGRFETQFLYVPCNVQHMDELQNLWDASNRPTSAA